MNSTTVQKTLDSVQFKKLVSNRWAVSLGFSLVVLFVYFGFILTIAFNKNILAIKIGTHLTLALPIGFGIILFAWILTGFYVKWANNRYDSQVEDIRNKFQNNQL